MRTILQTPPVPRIAPPTVFDAFGWCDSDVLEWRAPYECALVGPVTPDNPPRMVFVLKQEALFLPRELARYHVPGFGFEDEWALAPYGIDDATDELFSHRMRPGDALLLATDSLAGLFWGLHDWAHFHNHGSFVERAWTELQCDFAALRWLWLNRHKLTLDDACLSSVSLGVREIGVQRFADEGLSPPHGMLNGAYSNASAGVIG